LTFEAKLGKKRGKDKQRKRKTQTPTNKR